MAVDGENHVFINCPFDAAYRPVFETVVFAVHACGSIARAALETDDGSQTRIDKIFSIIAECRLGIHDISRAELDPRSSLPRFNMPLELGMFLGAKRYGNPRQRRKRCLIPERERYRYQQYCSDIAGQDIRAHGNSPTEAIRIVRDWLRNATAEPAIIIPSGSRIADHYRLFRFELPLMCDRIGLDADELIFNDLTTVISGWLQANQW
ncbi:MAG TPA: hypothetical protein VFR37_17720 [Longimicrobium sp.]|nr:hypothetical protein [Longimicrobium sp.]